MTIILIRYNEAILEEKASTLSEYRCASTALKLTSKQSAYTKLTCCFLNCWVDGVGCTNDFKSRFVGLNSYAVKRPVKVSIAQIAKVQAGSVSRDKIKFYQ